ncbi:MAG TPA: hypothetical protein VFQ90_17045 [Stellaceae bacterium]|jgi:hypothetical protein|nr:hypothetical protein [Stellaceae bacterium]
MSAATVYLSRLIGVVALVIAAGMLLDKATTLAAVDHLGRDRSSLLLLGVVRAGVGAGVVLIHNVWTRGFWPLVVTLTGWAMLVRGVMNLFLPTEVMAALLQAAHFREFYYLYALIPLLLGGYLALRGFSAPVPSLDAAGRGGQG